MGGGQSASHANDSNNDPPEHKKVTFQPDTSQTNNIEKRKNNKVIDANIGHQQVVSVCKTPLFVVSMYDVLNILFVLIQST